MYRNHKVLVSENKDMPELHIQDNENVQEGGIVWII
jgi:hypothetical protein